MPTDDKAELYFATPPLTEVSFSLQFEPIEQLHLGFLGLLWDVFRDRYPIAQHADEIDHVIEKFGVLPREIPQKLKFLPQLPLPRMMYFSEDKQFLIQVQKDRFILNWRNHESVKFEYPRYKNLKKRFLDEIEILYGFLKANNLPSPDYDQVEFTYTNHIDAKDHIAQEVFNDVIDEKRYSPSLELETFDIKLKHILKKDDHNIGRMYTSIASGSRKSDGSKLYILNFTTRTHPTKPSLEGVVEVMDIMREEINNSFSAITKPKMHNLWNRK
jgi:uncharacterized protein (TIGR04255 family)